MGRGRRGERWGGKGKGKGRSGEMGLRGGNEKGEGEGGEEEGGG